MCGYMQATLGVQEHCRHSALFSLGAERGEEGSLPVLHSHVLSTLPVGLGSQDVVF